MNSFEFDTNKSQINLAKHGIDFIEAQELWNDPDLIEIPAKTSDESRALVIAYYKGKYWSAVVTYRTPNVRIISVRRARKSEVDLYESI